MKSKIIKAHVILWLAAIASTAIILYMPDGPSPDHTFILFPILFVLGYVSILTLMRIEIAEPADRPDPSADDT